MKTKIHREIAAALLVLVALTSTALPQSVSDQASLGVVLANKPQKPFVVVQSVSSYTHYVDQTNGLSADDLVRYALLHNGELAAARQMIAEARGRFRQAGQR